VSGAFGGGDGPREDVTDAGADDVSPVSDRTPSHPTRTSTTAVTTAGSDTDGRRCRAR